MRAGNQLNLGCPLLCAIANHIGVKFCIEQPASSLFFQTPAMQALCQLCSASQVTFNMIEFGSATKKPTVLVGTVAWLHMMVPNNDGLNASSSSSGPREASKRGAQSTRPKVMAKAKATTTLVKRLKTVCKSKVWGTPALKQSQVYPVKFALRVVQLHWPARFQ